MSRDQAYSFQLFDSDTGCPLTATTPAGFERLFQDIAECGLGEDDLDEMVGIAATFRVEILGPPPA